jgi:hypothetical protein
MADSRRFWFSTNVFGLASRAEFVGFAQRVEALGYDTLFAADHLGSYAPFQLVAAAAQATSRIRLGTLVLNVPFWNPALLAREIATADVLTDRAEPGTVRVHLLHGACPVRRGIRSGHRAAPRCIARQAPRAPPRRCRSRSLRYRRPA